MSRGKINDVNFFHKSGRYLGQNIKYLLAKICNFNQILPKIFDNLDAKNWRFWDHNQINIVKLFTILKSQSYLKQDFGAIKPAPKIDKKGFPRSNIAGCFHFRRREIQGQKTAKYRN